MEPHKPIIQCSVTLKRRSLLNYNEIMQIDDQSDIINNGLFKTINKLNSHIMCNSSSYNSL